MDFIGRQIECAQLRSCEMSGKAELVVVYGRFRVGKTFLINHYFSNRFTYRVTGISDGKMQDQLGIFYSALTRYFGVEKEEIPTDWMSMFVLLTDCLKRNKKPAGQKVIFIDEISFLDTPKSNFLPAFEHFWNSFASRRDDVLLIACSSAGPWVTGKLLGSFGNFHGKVTRSICVEPLNLRECEQYYRSRSFAFTRRQILELYMFLGGIPFYMDSLDNSLDFDSNVNALFFGKTPKLGGEFDRLYRLFFRVSDNHIRAAKALSRHTQGLNRQELAAASGVPEGGGLTKVLSDMESCGLIRCISDFRRKKGSGIYRLSDPFTGFYFEFLEENRGDDPEYWSNFTRERERVSHPFHRVTANAFAQICESEAHIAGVKKKLGISGMKTEIVTFRSTGEMADGESGWSGYKRSGKSAGSGKKRSAQGDSAVIAIVIDRPDGIVNLCFCKYSAAPYVLTERDKADLERRISLFARETGTKKDIQAVLISSNEFSLNSKSEVVDAEIILEDLFA